MKLGIYLYRTGKELNNLTLQGIESWVDKEDVNIIETYPQTLKDYIRVLGTMPSDKYDWAIILPDNLIPGENWFDLIRGELLKSSKENLFCLHFPILVSNEDSPKPSMVYLFNTKYLKPFVNQLASYSNKVVNNIFSKIFLNRAFESQLEIYLSKNNLTKVNLTYSLGIVFKDTSLEKNYYKFIDDNFSKYFQKVPRKIISFESVQNIFNKGDLVLDLGANIGQEARPLLEKGCIVESYEPDPFAFKKLQEAVKDYSNAHIYNAAVLDKNTTMKLFFHQDHQKDSVLWSTGSSLKEDKRNVKRETFTEVVVKDIKEIIENLKDKIKVLKMDVEGAEYEILERLIETNLYKKIDYIFVETHHTNIPSLVNKHRGIVKKLKEMEITNIYLGWT